MTESSPVTSGMEAQYHFQQPRGRAGTNMVPPYMYANMPHSPMYQQMPNRPDLMMLQSQQSSSINTIPQTVQYIENKRVIGPNGQLSTRQSLVQIKLPSEEYEEANKMELDGVAESQSEEVFSSYCCRSLPITYNCITHPGSIVEAGSLAAQSLPKVHFDLMRSLPENILLSGQLSDLQIEGILFACQRHQLILPDGFRAGFFLGDGTGVGKGRQIAGIILDSLCRGRMKHIWFSISSDLRHDAERDLQDLGCYTKVIDGCQQLDKETKAFGLVSDYKDGILFSTYSTLVSSVQSNKILPQAKTSRLDQLIKWCGKDFDGCLIFDECHKAKHFIPGKEKNSTKVAVAVTMIQRLLPKARVVYCSATGVTDVKNMAFMERLGIWGVGTPFRDFDIFHESLTKRGLGALEMLSMEMKAAGMYISRGLSYKDTEFHMVEATLTKEQQQIYDKVTHVWRELHRCMGHAIARTKSNPARLMTQYWASHQRFFKQLCMSMKVPSIVKEAKAALQDGYCVVIGLQTTGEASLDAELDQNDGDIKGFISLTREILKRFVLQFFPTEIKINADETKIDDWCVQAQCMLLDYVEQIELPFSPLDEIIDELGGPNFVAEMTGRKGYIGRYNKADTPKYYLRGGGSNLVESGNVVERNAFMHAEKDIAIISDAASTGISLHADKGALNQKRRMHITVELPWSADKAVQQLGRSHRSNQSSAPIYKLVTSNLGGERRFAAAVAKRLQSLGALTKGDRRAASGTDLCQFNFDTPYGKQALKMMYDSIIRHCLCSGVSLSDVLNESKTEEDLAVTEFHEIMITCLGEMDILVKNTIGSVLDEKYVKDVGKFLNRILGLEVRNQNLIFAYFCCCLDSVTQTAKREGRQVILLVFHVCNICNECSSIPR